MSVTVDPQVTCVTGNCAHRTCGLLLLRAVVEDQPIREGCDPRPLAGERRPAHVADSPCKVEAAGPPVPSNSVLRDVADT